MWVLVQGIIVFLIINSCYSALPSEEDVLAALDRARTIARIQHGLDNIERDLDGPTSSRSCPMSITHGKRLYGNTTVDRKVNDVLHAMRILRNLNGHSLREVNNEQVHEMFKKENGDTCAVATPPGTCDPDATYRSADGSCNNLDNPSWGMALTSQERLLKNAYSDELGEPRNFGIDGDQLPNPRLVSNLVHNSVGKNVEPSQRLTLMAMSFGQFLDHDITLTPEISEYENCCESTAAKDIDNCFNIISPEDDNFQDIFTKDHCIEFKRSSPVLCPDSQSEGKSVRQQLNLITSYIDASNVYGSSLDQQTGLRNGVNGNGFLLQTSTHNEGQERILDGDEEVCPPDNNGHSCSKAGDIRVNEVPPLTSMHYLFVKEHNRIAKRFNNFYTGRNRNEIIFQETKKLVTAIMQKIVYDEFLPSFLSKATMDKYELKTSNIYRYDRRLNPTILNSFAAAAYRLGHTWIPSEVNLYDKDFNAVPNEGMNTEDTFHDPTLTYRPRAFARLMYYLSGAASPETDRFLVEAVRSNLFIDASENFALDLAALNIQRGRDHGLPSYNEYRIFCGLEQLDENWQDEPLTDLVDGIKEKLIEAGYKSPRDIDLFTGGLAERPVPDGTLGPTFECLLGEQFRRLKFGDRFWFQGRAADYSQREITEIQNYSFSKLLCVNYNYKRIQYPSAFKLTDALKDCGDIKDIDFNVFNPRQSRPQPGQQKKDVFNIENDLLIDLLEELENE